MKKKNRLQSVNRGLTVALNELNHHATLETVTAWSNDIFNDVSAWLMQLRDAEPDASKPPLALCN